MDKSGWWISPVGESIEVIDHFDAVRSEPWRFGFRKHEGAHWTRRDRRFVLRRVISRGWIRARGHGPYTTLEVYELDGGTSSRIARHLRSVGAWRSERIDIHELKTRKRVTTSAGCLMG